VSEVNQVFFMYGGLIFSCYILLVYYIIALDFPKKIICKPNIIMPIDIVDVIVC
jgi:hypothetical protein